MDCMHRAQVLLWQNEGLGPDIGKCGGSESVKSSHFFGAREARVTCRWLFLGAPWSGLEYGCRLAPPLALSLGAP